MCILYDLLITTSILAALDAQMAFGKFGEGESRPRAVRSTVGFDRMRCPLSPRWRLRALSLRRSHDIPIIPRGYLPRSALGGRQGHGHRVRVPQVNSVGFSLPISRFSAPSSALPRIEQKNKYGVITKVFNIFDNFCILCTKCLDKWIAFLYTIYMVRHFERKKY